MLGDALCVFTAGDFTWNNTETHLNTAVFTEAVKITPYILSWDDLGDFVKSIDSISLTGVLTGGVVIETYFDDNGG